MTPAERLADAAGLRPAGAISTLKEALSVEQRTRAAVEAEEVLAWRLSADLAASLALARNEEAFGEWVEVPDAHRRYLEELGLV
jgi:hypothetical protein